MRTVIVGGPGAGKTTRAAWLKAPLTMHTDDLIDSHTWSQASAQAANWLDTPGHWVIEGVTAVRALRKWLNLNAAGTPCDVVLVMNAPYPGVVRTTKQAAMAAGCQTILNEILPALKLRGVKVRYD